MPTFIALLRGINVSGQKLISMEKLRASCEKAGFKKVRTYVQSGNVVFEVEGTAAAAAARLSKLILKDFKFEVSVEVRTPAEMGRLLRINPFLQRKGVDLKRLYVVFLSGPATQAGLKRAEAAKAPSECFECRGREVFLYFPDGYGKSKLNNNVLERSLGVTATTRNWNTVNALYKMASDS